MVFGSKNANAAAVSGPPLHVRWWKRPWVNFCTLPALGLGVITIFSPNPRLHSTVGADVPARGVRASSAIATGTGRAIEYFMARVLRDPEDHRSQNQLAELYLQRVRDTGQEEYLAPARKAAQASLAAVPAERNRGGLAALARTELAGHHFNEAKDHALRMVSLHPGEPDAYAILGDAWLELGDYARANEALHLYQDAGDTVASETRLARVAFLEGHPDRARDHFTAALVRLREVRSSPPEMVAWCCWQLGETAFSTGDYPSAERHYGEALVVVPEYFPALASLGRVCAARGSFPEAISRYVHAFRLRPAADYAAALGDLHQLSGKPDEAATHYAMVEELADHSRKIHGQPFNRQLALFYADHDIKAEEAYSLATSEYAVRQDIYGADAVAWTALKAGRLAEAEAASKESLRLGTRDAKLLYHAGMIARGAGHRAASADYLTSALTLSPGFDALQSRAAIKALQP